MTNRSGSGGINDDAAKWLMRSRRSRMTAADQTDLAIWLDSDARNGSALRKYGAIWSALHSIADEPAIMAIRKRVRLRRRRTAFGAFGIAASLAALVVLPTVETGWFGASHRSPGINRAKLATASSPASRFQTGTGEISKLALDDGSKVTLDADSLLVIRFSKQTRDLSLIKGRALFQVAHELRPFIVHTTLFAVRATGTKFIVDRERSGDTVRLIQGHVIARTSSQGAGHQVELSPGSQLLDQGSGRVSLSKFDATVAGNWMSGTLVFDQERLGVIIEQLNRYNDQKLVIADPALEDIRLSAVLKAGDSGTFLSSLDKLGIAHAEQRNSGMILITTR